MITKGEVLQPISEWQTSTTYPVMEHRLVPGVLYWRLRLVRLADRDVTAEAEVGVFVRDVVRLPFPFENDARVDTRHHFTVLFA